MRYCDNCKQFRADATTGFCPECGDELVDRTERTDTGSAPPVAWPQPVSLPPPAPAEPDPGPPVLSSEPDALPPASPPEDEPPRPADPTEHDDFEQLLQESTSSSAEPSSAEERTAPPPPRSEEATPESSSEDYQRIVHRVKEHVDQGYDLYGFVGHVDSGKTHCLKALDLLLRSHGVGSEKAQTFLDEAHVPGNSAAEVFAYVYPGARWVFIDAGGEIYQSLQDNDWSTLEAGKTELTHWLHRCRGLFMLLDLDKAHFDTRLMNKEPVPHADETPEEAYDRARKAFEAQRQLTFFRNFLLLLRALKAENGNVDEVFRRCRSHGTLEEALHDYVDAAPLLDIPVMFFFTKADSYGKGFEIADGVHLTPQLTPMGPMVFAARYLPLLFEGLLQHVRRFKFDFLQSHVEYPIMNGGRPILEENGQPMASVHWKSDPTMPLSVGLFPGLEFLLRNQDRGDGWRRLWTGPGIDTRLAMKIHQMRNPELWKGVKVDLGSWSQAWRSRS